MTVVILLLIMAATALYVFPPLLRQDERPVPSEMRARQDAFADAASRRDASYEALADLEFDYAAGKISQEDFARLKRQYQASAVKALKEIDALNATGSR